MRPLFLASALSLAPIPAIAQSISDEIGKTGLGPTEARLAALPAPTDADRFALGGVRFLAAAERALQLRWNVGLLPNLSGMPLFSLPIPDNPDAVPFQPAMIADLFRTTAAAMEGVRAPLAAIPDGSDFALDIDLADLWFDINANTRRDPGEAMLDVAGPMLLGWQWLERDATRPAPVVRFDAADAAWLSAYSHFLSGFGNAVLAYDPTTAIAEVRGARTTLTVLRGEPRGDLPLGMYSEWIDIATVALHALDQPPNIARAAQARSEFLAMIADNRTFWHRVATETDNAHEWLPNDRQQSALGIDLPQGTGALWLDVLADAEALLTGTALAPYLWLGDDAGVNIARLFTDPRPIKAADWVQGIGALPYLEKGRLVSPANWQRFTAMAMGDALLFTVLLN